MRLGSGAPPTVIFLHIPKTAGSTLRRLLAAQYPPARVHAQAPREGNPADAPYLRFLREGGTFAEERTGRPQDQPIDLPKARRGEVDLVMGHYWFGVHRGLPRPSTYVTVVRDPVERVRSLHHHRLAHHQLDQSLKEYLDAGRDFEIDNGQTRRVAGIKGADGDVRFAPPTEEMLETAKRNLREHFSVVGVTERFDEFVVGLQRAFGWTIRGYVTSNVSRDRPRDELPSDLRSSIEARNELDRELHRFAGELQAEQLRSLAPDLEGDLRRLRRWSDVYRRARPVLRTGGRLRRVIRGRGS